MAQNVALEQIWETKFKKFDFWLKTRFSTPKTVKNEGMVPKTTIFLIESVYFGPKTSFHNEFRAENFKKSRFLGEKSIFTHMPILDIGLDPQNDYRALYYRAYRGIRNPLFRYFWTGHKNKKLIFGFEYACLFTVINLTNQILNSPISTLWPSANHIFSYFII